MTYDERPVPASLSGIVTRIWFLEAEPIARFEKILPMPAVHVIGNLSDPYRIFDRQGSGTVVPAVFVSGLQSEYLVIESPHPIRHIGFELTPVGLAALAPGTPRSTAGRVKDAAPLLHGISAAVEDARRTPSCALERLERHLVALPRHPVDPVGAAAVGMLDDDSERRVGDIAHVLGVSHRVLVDRFEHATGATPKRYAQVLRFHRLLDAVHASGGRPDWAQLAVAAGYYDQPHVIRAFRRFSGWTPAEYFRLIAEHGPDAARFVPLDHVPV